MQGRGQGQPGPASPGQGPAPTRTPRSSLLDGAVEAGSLEAWLPGTGVPAFAWQRMKGRVACPIILSPAAGTAQRKGRERLTHTHTQGMAGARDRQREPDTRAGGPRGGPRGGDTAGGGTKMERESRRQRNSLGGREPGKRKRRKRSTERGTERRKRRAEGAPQLVDFSSFLPSCPLPLHYA